MASTEPACYGIVGDVHGHLQLALCMLARWQRERGRTFSAVFLCGDVGTFADESQLDSATRKHARTNPCELEFLTQWSRVPPAPWLEAIFLPEPHGLGLTCPVVMVHGNHEGFEHLQSLYPGRRRLAEPVLVQQLPPVDTDGHIQLLPTGWRAVTNEGYTIGGVGGVERGQRKSKYHELAYIQEQAVEQLLAGPLDILITHQGPAQVQGDHGSPSLDLLLDEQIARYWFHGHSTPVRERVAIGATTVVPLGDVAFSSGTPGRHGWAILELGSGEDRLLVESPPFWREVRQHHWHTLPDGRLVHPDLVPFLQRT